MITVNTCMQAESTAQAVTRGVQQVVDIKC